MCCYITHIVHIHTVHLPCQLHSLNFKGLTVTITLETYPTINALLTSAEFLALSHTHKVSAVKMYNKAVKTVKKQELELDNLVNFSFDKSQFAEFTDKVTALLEEVSSIYSHLKTKNGDQRRLMFAYAFNGLTNSIVTAASGIQFMPEEERKEILSKNGISMFTLEDIIASAGRTAYYSEKSESIVAEIPFDSTLLTNAIVQLSLELNTEITSSILNFDATNASRNFSSSRDRAQTILNESEALKLLMVEEPENYGD